MPITLAITACFLGKVREKGNSIVPLKFYFKDSLVKVEIALVRGKQNYDKRNSFFVKILLAFGEEL